MEKDATTFDPYKRYTSNPSALREALDRSKGIVVGLWALTAFTNGDETSLKRYTLKIRVPKNSDWEPISQVLKSDDYQLRGNNKAQYGGLLFVRPNNDNLPLEFDQHPELGWKDSKSLETSVMYEVMTQEIGCFMTSKYAVLTCSLQPISTAGGNIDILRRLIVDKYEARPQETAKERWNKIGDRIWGIVKLDDRPAEAHTFNHFLSHPMIFSFLSELPG